MSLQAILQRYFTRELPADFQPIIHLEVGTHDPTRDTSRFRVSDAGKCRLMRYWKRQGKPGQPYDGNPFVLEAGNLLHAYIQHAVIDQGLMIACEKPLEDEYRIGHFDMLIRDTERSRLGQYATLYELKTVSAKQFYYKQRNAAPDRLHVFQIVSYAWMYLQEDQSHVDLTDLRIAYLNRDSLQLLEFLVDFQTYISAVTSDWGKLFDAWNSQQEPEPNAESWECKCCQYAATCYP